MLYVPKRSNTIEASFHLSGRRFDLPSGDWPKLGAYAATRPDLPIDNVNIFEANWGFKEAVKDGDSTDEVIAMLLNKIYAHRAEFVSFKRENLLHATVECYVAYALDQPLTGLSEETIRRMAELECSFGIEVVKLRTP